MDENEQNHQPEEGDRAERERWQRLPGELGPPFPDFPVFCGNTSTAEGQAELRAYQQRCNEQVRQADEAWAREYPGVEFRRLTDRLKRITPRAVDPEPEG